MGHTTNRCGTGIHGLINFRAEIAQRGVVVYGSAGQGVKRHSACLDLIHAGLVRAEHIIFGLPYTTTKQQQQ
jgi:hypothetical protein